ncbi:RsmB/NOP family class I SAM-dependent RNA methyltransferase [Opitutus terrae]|uniref:Fmu (Sun) domain protein n=1 Tax=Opitutus terrae (strain DSM 11246 / JCM 15787 / PB90-1) TaxID=452637 RepID=B1ZMU6_OPITP|nr:RsmB/NOP family class I SAM-dependent RNA methyltransferase [Opitutus terrae]ACB75374.1 Fmu (Sun) domain protein [Opitutus terrae PB90-1]
MATPDQATLNHAAQILASISTDHRADLALRFYFERHRYLRPAAKRHISHAVFVYFRWLSWLDPKASPQKRIEQAAKLHERFTADPASIKVEALAARAVPHWLASEVELPADTLRQLQRDPALWIRVRRGHAAEVTKTLVHCSPAVLPAWLTGLEPQLSAFTFTGTQDLFRTEPFDAGEFEIQDLASQIVGHACAPQPRETWWDACAGEGGKMLHLADLMANKGLIWATDRNARRLETLKHRAARAQVFNYRTALWDGSARLPTKTKFDGILVDAPCSGVGTWQRNPQARWTATLDDVNQLATTQLTLLNLVAGSLKPRGRLIYSVCTLTRSETTAVADAFSAAHPELEPLPLFNAAGVADPGPRAPSPATTSSVPGSTLNPQLSTSASSLSASSSQLSSLNSQLFLWPHELNANGMFIAAWQARA